MKLVYSENKKVILGLASMLGLFAIWIIILIIVASFGNETLIGIFFTLMMLSSIVTNIYIAYKLLSVPCELHFGKNLEIKFLRKSLFYNINNLTYSKSDIIQVEESNSKGFFFYKSILIGYLLLADGWSSVIFPLMKPTLNLLEKKKK